MPKKTRKQKIAAQTRVIKTNSSHEFSFTASPSHSVSNVTVDTSDHENINDIRKTIILGTLFVVFEFLLYFGSPRLGW